MTTTARPDPLDLNPRQRWIAAQRIACGDSTRAAAALANARLEALLAIAEDPDFKGLVDDCRAVEALDRPARRARFEGLVLQAAERALADGNVSTVNACLRALRPLDDPDGEGEPDAYQEFLDGLTDDELAEFEAIGKPKPAAAAAAPVRAPSPPPPSSGEGEGARGELPSAGEGGGPPPVAAEPAAPPSAPRPNPNVVPLRRAREPVPEWHRHPGGWPPPRGS